MQYIFLHFLALHSAAKKPILRRSSYLVPRKMTPGYRRGIVGVSSGYRRGIAGVSTGHRRGIVGVLAWYRRGISSGQIQRIAPPSGHTRVDPVLFERSFDY